MAMSAKTAAEKRFDAILRRMLQVEAVVAIEDQREAPGATEDQQGRQVGWLLSGSRSIFRRRRASYTAAVFD